MPSDDLFGIHILQNSISAGVTSDPAKGAFDAPSDLLVGYGGGYPLPINHPPRRLPRLALDAFCPSPKQYVLALPLVWRSGRAFRRMNELTLR